MRCARCHRELRKPVLFAGMAFGSTCAKAVGAAVQETAKPKRQRGPAAPAAEVYVDPNQLRLELEVAA